MGADAEEMPCCKEPIINFALRIVLVLLAGVHVCFSPNQTKKKAPYHI